MDNSKLSKLAAQLQLELVQVNSSAGIPKLRFGGEGVLLHDLNGEPLAERYSLFRGDHRIGHVDVALHPVLGLPLSVVSTGRVWQPRILLERARLAASQFDPNTPLGSGRFILYSFPRLAVGFTGSGGATILVDIPTMEVVRKEPVERPTAFGELSPWSVLGVAWRESSSERERYAWWLEAARELSVHIRDERGEEWLYGLSSRHIFNYFAPAQVCERGMANVCINAKDEICFKGKGQSNGQWCVPACVDMLLDFFLPNADREELAAIELGQLDQNGNPIKLPEEEDVNIPIAIEKLAAKEKVILEAGMVRGIDLLDSVEDNFSKLKMPGPMILLGHSHAWEIFGFEECVTNKGGSNFSFKAFDPSPETDGEAKDRMGYSASLHRVVIFAQKP